MIKMEHVEFRYEGTEILHDVNFAMKDGEFVGILGPNGGGKSTSSLTFGVQTIVD